MSCKNATDNKYLNYICYVRYKSRFVEEDVHYHKSAFHKINEDHKKEIPSYLHQLLPVFDYLTRLLSDDPIHNWECNNNICCRYISYLIYKRVTDINNTNFNEVIFNYFHSLVIKFYKEEGSNRCDTNFDKLTPDDIKKMNLLYKLYDDYSYIENLYKKNPHERDRFCDYLAVIVNELNSLNEDYKKDNDLMNKFRAFVSLIEKHKWVTNNNCQKNLSHLSFDKTVPSPHIQTHEDQEQLRLTNPSSLQNVQVLESALSVRHDSSGLQEQSGSRGKLGSEDTLILSRLKEIDNGQNGPEHLILQQDRETVGSHKHNSFNTRSPVDDKNINALYTGPAKGYPPRNPSEKGGFMEESPSTLSTILGNVEPAPLLGVSGGIGALYLLLKYTPVGSYFGGRRQIRQIRRNVEGLSPGEFQNFYDHDGAHIGYGPMNISYQAE